MIETPIIFVTYPIGAGGWFLASLLSSTYTNSINFLKQNAQGSGHENTEIAKLNNWYTLVTDNVIQDILYQKNINNFLPEQRIDYLRNSLVASPNYNNKNVHVISLHCQDINLFLKAFSNSKAIIINITTDDVDRCFFNFVYKVLSLNLTYFQTLCDRHNQDYFKYVKFLQDINLESLEKLKWIVNDIKLTIPCVSIEPLLNSRVLNINYQEYVESADPLDLILKIDKFLNTNWPENIINSLVDHLVLYRLKQPIYPVN